jgi:hypothetical protein
MTIVKKWASMHMLEQGEECEQPFDEMPYHQSAIDQAPEVFVRTYETRTDSLMFGACVNSDAGLVGDLVVCERSFDLLQAETCAEMPYVMPSYMTIIKKWAGMYLLEQGEECEVPASDEPSDGTFIDWLLDLMKMEQVDEMPVEEMPVVDDGIIETETPPMNESGYHHYHHNGCPYMGGCPYCPPCYPPQSAVRIPDVQDNANAEESSTPVRVRRLPKAIKAYKKPIWDMYLRRLGSEKPTCPFTDTMECRPSDVAPVTGPWVAFPHPY